MELILAILIIWLLIAHRDFFKVLVGGFLALYAVLCAVDWIQTTSVANLSYLFVVFMILVILRIIHFHKA